MKAILMSIRPEWVAKILNGEKTIEIRKKFPKDYVGWVYIYCTKGGKQLVDCPQWVENELYHQLWYDKDIALLENSQMLLNGKVVARFWCDKVEEITFYPKKPFDRYGTPYRATYDLLTESCLEYDELDKYLNKNKGRAIHITKLEIFNKPKDIRDFVACKYGKPIWKPLSRPPQSWCYVEI